MRTRLLIVLAIPLSGCLTEQVSFVSEPISSVRERCITLPDGASEPYVDGGTFEVKEVNGATVVCAPCPVDREGASTKVRYISADNAPIMMTMCPIMSH